MNRLVIWVLALSFLIMITMAYGCVKQTDPLDKTSDVLNNEIAVERETELDPQQLSEYVVQKIDGENVQNENNCDGGSEILQKHVLFARKNVFYLSQFEEYSENNNGNFVLEAFDQDGSLVWQRKWMEIEIGELPMGSEPVVDGEFVYVGVYGNLYALELSNGDLIWETLSTGSTTTPLVYGDTIFTSSYESPFLTSVNKYNGNVNWVLSNSPDSLSPVKSWRWKNTIWIACETIFPGELQYVMLSLNGEILDYRRYARYEESIQFFLSEASGFKESEKDSFIPDNAFDSDVRTAWCADNEEGGIGEWIRFGSDREKVIKGIQVYNGHHGSHIVAQSYGKPSIIRIDFSNGDYLIYRFKKTEQLMNVEKIVLANLVVAYKMRMTILDTTLPDESLGVCISEIVVD